MTPATGRVTPAAARRQRGEGTVHLRSDGMWRGQIDVGTVNGKRRRKTVYATTQAACVKKLREARKAVDAGDTTTASMRVDKWLRYWLDNIAVGDVKPGTLRGYRSKVEQYLVPVLGSHRLHALTPAHVRELHASLRARDPALSSTSIAHAHRVLGNALNAAMREVGLPRNVAEVVEAPGNAASTRRALTIADARAVLTTAAADPATAARWLAALVTGARQGECLGLRWTHVHLDDGVMDLAWSLQRVPYRHGCVARRGDPATCGRTRADRCPRRALDVRDDLEHEVLDGSLCLLRPKTTGSIRIVPLIPAMTAALRLHRQATADEPNPHDLVWHRTDGRPVDNRVDYLAWIDLLTRAGVAPRTLHEARHTTATLLADAGVDRQVIAQILGHSSVATGLIYTHTDIRHAREALTGLGATLELPAASS